MTPTWDPAMASKSGLARSMMRPSTYGPRSLTVQMTERPLAVLVTLTFVPLGRVRWAQPPVAADVYHEALPPWPLAYLVVVVVGGGGVVVVGLGRVVVVVCASVVVVFGCVWVVVGCDGAAFTGGGAVVAGAAAVGTGTGAAAARTTGAGVAGGSVERVALRPALPVDERSSSEALSRVCPGED